MTHSCVLEQMFYPEIKKKQKIIKSARLNVKKYYIVVKMKTKWSESIYYLSHSYSI